jgi:hypothetical protein
LSQGLFLAGTRQMVLNSPGVTKKFNQQKNTWRMHKHLKMGDPECLLPSAE